MTPLESALRAADLHIPDAAGVIRAHVEALSAQLHDQRWQHAQELKRAEQAERERDALRDELKHLYRAYVRLLEAGRDRITGLGGECDPVDMMERTDPDLIQARRALEPK